MWSGCAVKETAPATPAAVQIPADEPEEPVEQIESYLPWVTNPSETDEMCPAWMTNPDIGGHIGAIGYAKKQDSRYRQRQTALGVAKARLSARIHIRTTSARANRWKEHMMIRDEYIDGNGALYLWLTVDKDAF